MYSDDQIALSYFTAAIKEINVISTQKKLNRNRLEFIGD